MASPKVLVVDDEPAVLSLVANALSRRGYEIHAAPGPMEALELAKAAPCFDLVLSDVVMPEMSGPELVRSVTQICPNVAVVLMSGHFAVEALPEGTAFISKPFRMTDLYAIVEKALLPHSDVLAQAV